MYLKPVLNGGFKDFWYTNILPITLNLSLNMYQFTSQNQIWVFNLYLIPSTIPQLKWYLQSTTYQKIYSTLELEWILNKGIRIPQLAKITTLFSDWWRSLNLKKGLIIWLHRKGGGLERHAPHYSNVALNVDLFKNIFSYRSAYWSFVSHSLFKNLNILQHFSFIVYK